MCLIHYLVQCNILVDLVEQNLWTCIWGEHKAIISFVVVSKKGGKNPKMYIYGPLMDYPGYTRPGSWDRLQPSTTLNWISGYKKKMDGLNWNVES